MRERLREWWHRLAGTFANRHEYVEEELRFHLEMTEQKALRRGDSARDARIQAGSLTQASEAMRDQRLTAAAGGDPHRAGLHRRILLDYEGVAAIRSVLQRGLRHDRSVADTEQQPGADELARPKPPV